MRNQSATRYRKGPDFKDLGAAEHRAYSRTRRSALAPDLVATRATEDRNNNAAAARHKKAPRQRASAEEELAETFTLSDSEPITTLLDELSQAERVPAARRIPHPEITETAKSRKENGTQIRGLGPSAPCAASQSSQRHFSLQTRHNHLQPAVHQRGNLRRTPSLVSITFESSLSLSLSLSHTHTHTHSSKRNYCTTVMQRKNFALSPSERHVCDMHKIFCNLDRICFRAFKVVSHIGVFSFDNVALSRRGRRR